MKTNKKIRLKKSKTNFCQNAWSKIGQLGHFFIPITNIIYLIYDSESLKHICTYHHVVVNCRHIDIALKPIFLGQKRQFCCFDSSSSIS